MVNDTDEQASAEWEWLLADVQKRAVRAILADVLRRGDVAGVVLAGSIVRGEGGPTSDLDMYVVVTSPYRQRRQLIVDGVRAEVFINPPWTIRSYFAAERRDGRPSTAHMLATGHVLYRCGPVLDALRDEASALLAAGPPELGETDLHWRRYVVIDLVEDAEDVRNGDPDALAFLLPTIVERTIALIYAQGRRWHPKPKRLPADLDVFDPRAGTLLRAYLREPDLAARHAAALALVDYALGGIPPRFFPWDSEPEYVPPDGAEGNGTAG